MRSIPYHLHSASLLVHDSKAHTWYADSVRLVQEPLDHKSLIFTLMRRYTTYPPDHLYEQAAIYLNGNKNVPAVTKPWSKEVRYLRACSAEGLQLKRAPARSCGAAIARCCSAMIWSQLTKFCSQTVLCSCRSLRQC